MMGTFDKNNIDDNTIFCTLNEEFVSSEELRILHSEVEKLVTFHQVSLKATGNFADAEKIVVWIERCEQGSEKAGRKLFQQGLDMLEKIKANMHLGLEEQQRMEEESPSVASDVNARGRRAERYAKAAGSANESVTAMENLIETNTKPIEDSSEKSF